MDNSKEQQSASNRRIDEFDDSMDQFNGEYFSDDPASSADSSCNVGMTSSERSSSTSGGSAALTERLTNFLVEGSDGDLTLSLSDQHDNLLQWHRALDVHVMGACRSDERLKPLFKLNVSTGVAEDLLLAHLSQYFEPSEVGMLARCLCVPLVSVRVGKITKQGALLCPTAIRGNLNLTLLPTSGLRISFIGDDGSTERLVTLSTDAECSTLGIEEIIADKSGRSFSIRIPDYESFYFWCSEKSKLLGMELLKKMKDLLVRKPSLAELTGISESRLNNFSIHLRAYLFGSTMVPCLNTSVESSELNVQSSVGSSTPSRFRHNGGQGAKSGPLYQGSLSPRPSSFKEGVQRNLSSLKSVARDKMRRHGDNYMSSRIDTLGSPGSPDLSSNCSEDKSPEATENDQYPSSSFLDSLPILNTAAQVPLMGSSRLAPYYCWCPPVASTLQYTAGSKPLSSSSLELPPLPTSLLSATRSSSILASIPPLNLSEIPSFDLPPILPEPLVRFPLALPSSQQIATFTPLLCDPIVHVSVIDVCSSGQGYLVSASPGLSSSIPSLHPTLVSPLIPEANSVVEKSARETLRMLISGSSNQPSPPLIGVFPSIFTNRDEMQSIVAAGGRGLYIGTKDINATVTSIAAMGLIPPFEEFLGRSIQFSSKDNLVGNREKSDGSRSENGFPNIEEERRD